MQLFNIFLETGFFFVDFQDFFILHVYLFIFGN
jgi:hypothetical protein